MYYGEDDYYTDHYNNPYHSQYPPPPHPYHRPGHPANYHAPPGPATAPPERPIVLNVTALNRPSGHGSTSGDLADGVSRQNSAGSEKPLWGQQVQRTGTSETAPSPKAAEASIDASGHAFYRRQKQTLLAGMLIITIYYTGAVLSLGLRVNGVGAANKEDLLPRRSDSVSGGVWLPDEGKKWWNMLTITVFAISAGIYLILMWFAFSASPDDYNKPRVFKKSVYLTSYIFISTMGFIYLMLLILLKGKVQYRDELKHPSMNVWNHGMYVGLMVAGVAIGLGECLLIRSLSHKWEEASA